MSTDDNAPEQAREPVDVVRLAVLAETAARAWDGYTWRAEPTVLARADVDVATFAWPVVADLYELLDPPAVVRLVDELAKLRAAVERHEAERQHGELIRVTEWVVLYDGEDDGERYVDRAHAEGRIEEIREQIADGERSALAYEPMTIAVTHQWRSHWTDPSPIPQGDNHEQQERRLE